MFRTSIGGDGTNHLPLVPTGCGRLRGVEEDEMPYGPWDEYFVHQLPSTMDVVHDSDPSWSDRCCICCNSDLFRQPAPHRHSGRGVAVQ